MRQHNPDENASDQPLPGTVSNQNGEEAEPGHQGGSSGSGEKRSSGGAAAVASSSGESGEGSQSTGHPDSAG